MVEVTVVVCAVILFAVRMLLVRFRLNDISPDHATTLMQKGTAGVLGRFMIDFAPSNKEPGSSFDEVRRRMSGVDGKPNAQLPLLNGKILIAFIAIVVVVVMAIIRLFR